MLYYTLRRLYHKQSSTDAMSWREGWCSWNLTEKRKVGGGKFGIRIDKMTSCAWASCGDDDDDE